MLIKWYLNFQTNSEKDKHCITWCEKLIKLEVLLGCLAVAGLAWSAKTWSTVRKRRHVSAAMCWSICVCERVRECVSMCVHRRVDGNVLVGTSLLHSLCRFLLLSRERQAAYGGREGEMRWLSRRCLERQVGQFGSWNLTRVRCQRQSTARKAYNRASSISWPSCWAPVSFVTSGKLAGWSVHLYNTHPDFERGKSENCAYYDRIFTADGTSKWLPVSTQSSSFDEQFFRHIIQCQHFQALVDCLFQNRVALTLFRQGIQWPRFAKLGPRTSRIATK